MCYKNLFDAKNFNVSRLFDDLKFNYLLLNKNFIYDYSYVLYKYANVISYGSGPGNNQLNNPSYNDASINNYQSLYDNVYNLYTIIDYIFNRVSNNYNILEKSINYINKSYVLTGSKLLINSYLSNSISIKFNIKYNSYLYQEIDLGNISLDITIPDITPPTIIFKNNDISFSETYFSGENIDELIEILISDISYIDLNQNFNFSVNNTNYDYINTNDLDISSIENNIYSLITIDLTGAYVENFGLDNNKYVDIVYKIKDNANNENTITRTLLINKDFDEPIFLYNDVYINRSNEEGFNLTINQEISLIAFKNLLTANIKVIDPIISDLSGLTEALKPENLIDIRNIAIFKNSQLILNYDISNDNFIYSIIQNSEFVLDEDGIYNLEYTSNRSDRTNKLGFIDRRLIVNKFIIEPVIEEPTHCCYPKVYYKPIQHNYKLGSQNSSVMKYAKLIINRHI